MWEECFTLPPVHRLTVNWVNTGAWRCCRWRWTFCCVLSQASVTTTFECPSPNASARRSLFYLLQITIFKDDRLLLIDLNRTYAIDVDNLSSGERIQTFAALNLIITRKRKTCWCDSYSLWTKGERKLSVEKNKLRKGPRRTFEIAISHTKLNPHRTRIMDAHIEFEPVLLHYNGHKSAVSNSPYKVTVYFQNRMD